MPVVATAEEIGLGLAIFGKSREEKAELVNKECVTLEMYHYVENKRSGNKAKEPLWALTGKGLAQIGQEAEKLDEYIWGKHAY